MEQLRLEGGLTLRLLSGMELLEARREARELCRDPREQPLCSNACLLARALGLDGAEGPLFADGTEVLIGLTVEEIEGFCAQWDEFRRNCGGLEEENVEYGVNENFAESFGYPPQSFASQMPAPPQGGRQVCPSLSHRKLASPFRGEVAEDREVGGGKP